MAVRITITNSGDDTILSVDGWLTHEDTAELIRASRDCPPDVVIDLSELRVATPEGLHALTELRERGARLTRLRPWLSMLLDKTESEIHVGPHADPDKGPRGPGANHR